MSDLVHIAQQLAHTVEKTAVAKDSAGQHLNEEVEKLKESGILAATVPQRLGGPETQPTDIAEIFRLLGTADGSFAQIPQSHFVFSRWLFSGEKPEEEDKWAQRLLDGALIANAQAELGEPTLLHKDGEHFLLKGEKHFCTGSIHADYLAITARKPGDDTQTLGVFLPADSPGVKTIDDWNGLGQRLSGSGTVRLNDVECTNSDIYTFDAALQLPTYGSFAQLLHLGIDVGLLDAALNDAFSHLNSRTWPEPYNDSPSDTLTYHLAGELQAQRFAANASLEKAAAAVEAAWNDEATNEEAALAVAAAKTIVSSASVDIASRAYELLGTAVATGSDPFVRYWKNLRTHTLHERRRDKLAAVGRAVVTGQPPQLSTKF